MKAKPRNEWVLVRRLQQGEQKVGELFIPADEKRSTTGIVEDIGSKVQDLQIGDNVIFTNFAMDVEVLGDDLTLVREEEVYAILSDDEVAA